MEGKAKKMVSAAQTAREVLQIEASGLTALIEDLPPGIEAALDLMLACQGRVIFSGMGKSGHIAAKLAATMASTGTPAYSIHPGEASHGDLGMITKQDLLVLLSNSGNTAELGDVITFADRHRIPIIGISKNSDSKVAKAATVFLQLPDVEEACTLKLAPTTSTTMTLALGDALCVALMKEKGFKTEDFHALHPGGKLGLDLLEVKSLMRSKDQVPCVALSSTMDQVLDAINKGGLGLVALIEDSRLKGIITDGDIRRNSILPLREQNPAQIMSAEPISIPDSAYASDALKIMNDKGVTALIVRNQAQRYTGLLHIHDLLRAGIG